MKLHDWIAIGREHGFCSAVTCETHDGIPMSDKEYAQFDNGDDPCVLAVRIYTEDTTMEDVEREWN